MAQDQSWNHAQASAVVCAQTTAARHQSACLCKALIAGEQLLHAAQELADPPRVAHQHRASVRPCRQPERVAAVTQYQSGNLCVKPVRLLICAQGAKPPVDSEIAIDLSYARLQAKDMRA